MHASSINYQPIAYFTAFLTVRYHNQHFCVTRCSTTDWVILVAFVNWTHKLRCSLQRLGPVSLQQAFYTLVSASKWTSQNPYQMQKVFLSFCGVFGVQVP